METLKKEFLIFARDTRDMCREEWVTAALIATVAVLMFYKAFTG